MPIYGFDETKSKFPVLDKATYDPANKSGQIAVINDIKPVVLTDDATVNPLIPTLYVMNAASKTITLGTNVNAGIKVTVFAKIATTISYIVNGVTKTDLLSADNVINYVFNGSYWVVDNTDNKSIGGGYIHYQENTITGNQTVDGTVTADGLLLVNFGKADSTGYSLNIAINGVVAAFIYQGVSIYPNGTITLPVKSGDTYSIYTNNDPTGHWYIHIGLIKYR